MTLYNKNAKKNSRDPKEITSKTSAVQAEKKADLTKNNKISFFYGQCGLEAKMRQIRGSGHDDNNGPVC